jgi:hypothetical protein
MLRLACQSPAGHARQGGGRGGCCENRVTSRATRCRSACTIASPEERVGIEGTLLALRADYRALGGRWRRPG